MHALNRELSSFAIIEVADTDRVLMKLSWCTATASGTNLKNLHFYRDFTVQRLSRQ